MLPVTQWPPGRPGSWGSPFSKPHQVDLRHWREGFKLPKGVWMVKTGPNKVELIIEDEDEDREHEHAAEGAGITHGPPMLRRRRFAKPEPEDEEPEAMHHKPPRPGDNSRVTFELIGEHTAGNVFADGWNVRITGSGEATIIRVYSV